MKYIDDSELTDSRDDLLDRKVIAGEIGEMIIDLPKENSFRIAVNGDWGSGKSSTLNFLKEYLEEKNKTTDSEIMVIRFDPIPYWNNGEALFEGLRENLRIGNRFTRLLSRIGNWFIYVGKLFKKVFGWTDYAPETKIVGSMSKDAYRVLSNYLKSRKYYEKKLKNCKHKRVILIDELDRADPKDIPLLLISLKEIFNLPNVVFVLSYDTKVISRAFRHHHPSFGDGFIVQEKFIDYSYPLPNPTSIQIAKVFIKMVSDTYGKYDIASFNQEVKPEDIQNILPNSIRALKHIVKMMHHPVKAWHQRGLYIIMEWKIIVYLVVLKYKSEQLFNELKAFPFSRADSSRNKDISLLVQEMVDNNQNDFEKDDVSFLNKLLSDYRPLDTIMLQSTFSYFEPISTVATKKIISQINQNNVDIFDRLYNAEKPSESVKNLSNFFSDLCGAISNTNSNLYLQALKENYAESIYNISIIVEYLNKFLANNTALIHDTFRSEPNINQISSGAINDILKVSVSEYVPDTIKISCKEFLVKLFDILDENTTSKIYHFYKDHKHYSDEVERFDLLKELLSKTQHDQSNAEENHLEMLINDPSFILFGNHIFAGTRNVLTDDEFFNSIQKFLEEKSCSNRLSEKCFWIVTYASSDTNDSLYHMIDEAIMKKPFFIKSIYECINSEYLSEWHRKDLAKTKEYLNRHEGFKSNGIVLN